MALFGKKKDTDIPKSDEVKEVVPVPEKEEKAEKGTPKKTAPKSELVIPRDFSSVIIRPRITEKAAMGTDRNMYTFEIAKNATKHDVRDAIKEFYGVTPVKVNIVKKQPRHYVSRMRGRDMMEKGLKKAYVFLKEGDRIDIV